MLNEVKNISVGETELVIGISFELLTKLTLSVIKTGDLFRRGQAESCIAAAFGVLDRNVGCCKEQKRGGEN